MAGCPALEDTMAPSFEQIRNIISEQLGIDPSIISEESRLIEDLGADSIDAVELTMAFETAFEIEIPDSDMNRMKTAGDVLHYLAERIS